MGEPAFKFDDDDKPEVKPAPKRRFGVVQGGGEGDGIPVGNLSAVPEDTADTREAVNASEQNAALDTSANEDLFGYLKNRGLIKDEAPDKKRGWLVRHKGAVAGGGSVIITIAGFFSFAAPLKLQAMAEMVSGVGMARVQGYIEQRAEKVVFGALLERFGIQDRSLVKGGSVISRIAKTMTANKYEERLAQRGLEFFTEGEGKARALKVRVSGASADEASALAKKVFTNSDDLQKALDGIPASKKIMKTIMKEDLGVWRFLVRGKLLTWLKSYFNIKRWGAKDTDKNASAEDKQKTAAIDELDNAADVMGDVVEESLDIAKTTEKLGQTGTIASDTATAATKTSLLDGLTSGFNDAKAGVKATSEKAIAETVMRLSERLGVGIAEKTAVAIGEKFVPIYGEVTLGAMLTVFANWATKHIADGTAARAIAFPAASLMSSTYTHWASIGAQSKAGTLDPDLYNFYTPFWDGAETSALFNCISTGWAAGCDSAIGEPVYKKVNETSSAAIQEIAKLALLIPGGVGDTSPNYIMARIVYNIDNAIMGAVMDYVNAQVKVGVTIASFFIPQSVKDQIMTSATTILGNMASFALTTLKDVFGFGESPTMGGNKLLDMSINGSVYSMNRYTENGLGGHQITDAEATAQTQKYIAENNDYARSKGLMYALFSPEVSNSLTSQLLARTTTATGPTDILPSFVSTLASIMKGTPSSLASITTSTAGAASYTSPEAVLGIVPFGLSDADLAAPLNDAVYTGDPCQTKSQTGFAGMIADWMGTNTKADFSTCLLDTAVAESVDCATDTMKAESADCNADLATSINNANSSSDPASIPVIGTTTWPVSEADWPGDVFDCDFRYQGEGGTVHTGIDISVSYKPVYAAVDGVIRLPDAGMVDIEYKDQNGKVMYFNYQHLSQRVNADGSPLTDGQQVKAGQKIGVSGMTNTTSPHLHLSLWDVPVVSGHKLPSSAEGAAALSHMWHPLSILPANGRPAASCGSAPYHVPGGH